MKNGDSLTFADVRRLLGGEQASNYFIRRYATKAEKYLYAWRARIEAAERSLEQREREAETEPKILRAERKRLEARRKRLSVRESGWMRAQAKASLLNWSMDKLRADIIAAFDTIPRSPSP